MLTYTLQGLLHLTFKFTKKSILCYECGLTERFFEGLNQRIFVDMLGSDLKPGFRSFVGARKYVRKLGLNGWKDWYKFSSSGKRPEFIPSTPHRQYKDEWISIRDWLGLHEVKKVSWLTFCRARALVRKKKFGKQGEFRLWIVGQDVPVDLPRTPQTVYRDKGWKGWADFLGNRHFGKKGRKFRSFRSARAEVRRLKLKGWKEWRAWAASDKRPSDIPAQPAKVYQGEGWVNVADWLGYRGRFAGARYVSKKSLAVRTRDRHLQLLKQRKL